MVARVKVYYHTCNCVSFTEINIWFIGNSCSGAFQDIFGMCGVPVGG